MISKSNYFDKVRLIKPGFLPAGLKSGFDFTKEATDNHSTWEYYSSETAIKSKIDEYFKALAEFLNKDHSKTLVNGGSEAAAREIAKKLIHTDVVRGQSLQNIKAGQEGHHGSDYSVMIKGNHILVDRIGKQDVNYKFTVHSIYNEILDHLNNTKKAVASYKKIVEPAKPSKVAKKLAKPAPGQPMPVKPAKPVAAKVTEVERIEEEVKLIKRYAMMEGKRKTDIQLLNLLGALQKAIFEKRIRKTSLFKKEIDYMQQSLVNVVNRLQKIPKPDERVATVSIDKTVLQRLLEIAGSVKVRLSLNYLKRYVGIQGRALNKDKAQRLLDLLKKALSAGKIKGTDLYGAKVKEIQKSLTDFVKSANKKDSLEVHEAVLNGLNGILGCGCDEKKKDDPNPDSVIPLYEPPKNTVMNSLDFAKLKFDTLGFTGKWLRLIGDPCAGFTAMVFGKPKMGKSYLCVEWAGYLARHHGNTLYVAREEQLNGTLQKKLDEKNVKHRSLDVSDHLPADLSPYEFVFLDSVNKLGLSPQDLDRLKAENPGKSFIDVHQTTKTGKFRGTNEYQHDVDIVIEVPERGKAVQFGRFNQGGEIPIFNQDTPLCDDGDYPMAA